MYKTQIKQDVNTYALNKHKRPVSMYHPTI